MDHALVGAAAVGDMVAVIVEKERQAALDLVGARLRSRGGEAPGDQGAGAVADHMAHLGERNPGSALCGKHVVERRRKIGGGFDQGAVEIEHQSMHQSGQTTSRRGTEMATITISSGRPRRQ